MGVFGTKPAPGMYPGDIEILSNAALGGAVLTQSVAPSATIGGAPANLTVINKSAATLTIEVAQENVAASFEPLSGVVCAANSAISFSTTAPFVAVLPGTDPSTGVITICR
jgi:hypothetical protein